MYGYNSNFFNNNLLDSIRKATQRVALGEEVLRMDKFDTLDDERKRKLLATQKAGDAAERDAEGYLKVSGAISGVPDTEPGGDLYGVDPQGRAFVVTSPKRKAPTPSTAPTPTPATTAATAAKQESGFSPVGGLDVRSALQSRTVQGIQQAGLEADRQRRIARANEMTKRYGTIPGEGGTQVTRLQPDDIRPEAPEERKVVAPRAASGTRLDALSSKVASVTPDAQAAFAAASDTPAARRIRERQRLMRGGANRYQGY